MGIYAGASGSAAVSSEYDWHSNDTRQSVLFRTSFPLGRIHLVCCILHLLYYVRSCNRGSIIERSADHGYLTPWHQLELGTVSVR